MSFEKNCIISWLSVDLRVFGWFGSVLGVASEKMEGKKMNEVQVS